MANLFGDAARHLLGLPYGTSEDKKPAQSKGVISQGPSAPIQQQQESWSPAPAPGDAFDWMQSPNSGTARPS